VKSGDRAFAPTWKMVLKSKKGLMSEEEYTREYYKMMRNSYVQHRERWEQLLGQEEVVLVCFCGKDKFCHRHLLKDILVTLGGVDMGEI